MKLPITNNVCSIIKEDLARFNILGKFIMIVIFTFPILLAFACTLASDVFSPLLLKKE